MKLKINKAFERFKSETHLYQDLYFYPFKKIVIEYEDTFNDYDQIDALLKLPDLNLRDEKRFVAYSSLM